MGAKPKSAEWLGILFSHVRQVYAGNDSMGCGFFANWQHVNGGFGGGSFFEGGTAFAALTPAAILVISIPIPCKQGPGTYMGTYYTLA